MINVAIMHLNLDQISILAHWLIMLTLGITLAMKMVPSSVLAECRTRAQDVIQNERPVSRAAGAVIVVIWLLVAMLCTVWFYEAMGVKS